MFREKSQFSHHFPMVFPWLFPKYHHFPIIFPGFFWLFLVKSTKIHQNPPGSVIANRLYGFEIDIDFPQIFLTQNHSDECHGCAFRGLPRGDGPGMVDGPGRWCRVSGRCYGFFFLGWVYGTGWSISIG